MSQRWTAADIPDQTFRTVVVTGANSGLGYHAARMLADRGATVVVTCRDTAKVDTTIATLGAMVPGARLQGLALDLGSLDSVHRAAKRLHEMVDVVDLLINNAGVMWAPPGRTADGFETTFGVNHLGTFAFTGQVLDLLLARPGSRVVTVSSIAHQRGAIDFDDLQSERDYDPQRAYRQSKLANLLFTMELNQRLTESGAGTAALAAHPGNARTDLNRHLPWLFRGPLWGLLWPLTQDVRVGVLSILRAAVDPGARGGEYYGPDGLYQFKGYPRRLEPRPHAHDEETARRLWAESERLTGVTYDFTTGLGTEPSDGP